MYRTWWAIVLLAVSQSVLAYERPFPDTAKRARMTPTHYPHILLDKKIRVLSVSARIWNTRNMIEMPAYLPGENHTVHYTETAQGLIDRVWILTPEETRQPTPAELAKKRHDTMRK